MKDWMIYGANGYTGRLIAEAAARRGLRPILAGRSEPEISRLGEALDLPTCVFSLGSPEEVASHLEGVCAVLHCAGPFSRTFRPMLAGCERAGAHYLDITGELGVFEEIYARSGEITAAGIAAIPGVGADVVPTDCLAAMLSRDFPDATSLRLALSGTGVLSPGTAKTVLDGLIHGGWVRDGGRLVREAIAHRHAWIPFDGTRSLAMSVPLADLSSAFRSTRIRHIECYVKVPPLIMPMVGLARFATPLLAQMQGLIEQAIGHLVTGPSSQQREKGRTCFWGEVEDAEGRKVALRLSTPEPYQFTIESTLAAVGHVLADSALRGALTPSQAFGSDFVLTLPGVHLDPLSSAAR